MTDLNERGLKDGLEALAGIRRVVLVRATEAERKAGEAEIEHHAMQKLLGFVNEQIGEYRAKLDMLLRQKEEPT